MAEGLPPTEGRHTVARDTRTPQRRRSRAIARGWHGASRAAGVEQRDWISVDGGKRGAADSPACLTPTETLRSETPPTPPHTRLGVVCGEVAIGQSRLLASLPELWRG